jgi:hypothetical protein
MPANGPPQQFGLGIEEPRAGNIKCQMVDALRAAIYIGWAV